MEKPVIISIKSTQNMDGQEDTIELVTQGVLRHSEEEGFALVYPESELTGLEGTLTTFRIAPDRITLLREGTINSEMIFEEGQNALRRPHAGREHPPGQGPHRGGRRQPLHPLRPGGGQPAHRGKRL